MVCTRGQALNYVIGVAQPKGLHQEIRKTSPWSKQYEPQTMQWPCWITTIFTCKVVVITVLVNWRQPKLTKNELKWQKISLLCNKTNEWIGEDLILTAKHVLPQINIIFRFCTANYAGMTQIIKRSIIKLTKLMYLMNIGNNFLK